MDPVLLSKEFVFPRIRLTRGLNIYTIWNMGNSGAILEIKDCVERRIGYVIFCTPPTGINPTVTTDWTQWLGEVTRTSELNQVSLFLIGTILQQICVYLPNSCLWTCVSNDANNAGFQFMNFFLHFFFPAWKGTYQFLSSGILRPWGMRWDCVPHLWTLVLISIRYNSCVKLCYGSVLS